MSEVLSYDPRAEVISAMDGFLGTIPAEACSSHSLDKQLSEVGSLGITHSDHSFSQVELSLDGHSTLTVVKETTTRVILGIKLRPATRYQVIYDHEATHRQITDDTPTEEAPDWGYDHWIVDTNRKAMYWFGMQRRYDHYEPHGGDKYPINRDPKGGDKQYRIECNNIKKLLTQGLSQ